jgi:integrase
MVLSVAQKKWAQRKVRTRLCRLVSLKEARALALKAAQKVARDGDPSDDKRAMYFAARDQSDLVEVLLDKFVTRYVKRKNRPRSIAEVERLIKTYIKPAWIGKKIGEIAKRDVLELLQSIEAPIAANRTFSVVRKFLNWQITQDVIHVSPVAGLEPPNEEVSRDRVLSDEEIRLLWRATEGSAPLAIMTRLLLLTGQRRNEVAGMCWSELPKDFDSKDPIWIIPAKRAKNDIEHAVPLAPQVVDILRALPRMNGSDFVLSTTGKSPVSGFSKFKMALDRAMVKEAKGPISEWRLHDIRRTVASGLARIGQRVEVAEKILNHTSGTFAGVVRVYQRYDFAIEKRQALTAWADKVNSIIAPRPADSVVVPFKAAV